MVRYAIDVVAKDMINLLLTINRRYKDQEVPDKIMKSLLEMYQLIMLYLGTNEFTADDIIRLYVSVNRKKNPPKDLLNVLNNMKTNKKILKLSDSITLYYSSFEVLIEIEEANPDIISYVLIRI